MPGFEPGHLRVVVACRIAHWAKKFTQMVVLQEARLWSARYSGAQKSTCNMQWQNYWSSPSILKILKQYKKEAWTQTNFKTSRY